FLNAKKNDDTPAASEGDIKFYVDHSQFKGSDSLKSYVEFYLMLYADQLKLVSKDEKKIGIFKVNISIKNNSGNEIQKREWTTEANVSQDSLDLKSLAIYDQWNENLMPGSYKIKVLVNDENGSNKGEVNFNLDLGEMNYTNFSASQIEFASQAVKGREDHFYKSNYSVVPNPSRRYGVLNPIIYLYYELYNLPENDEKISVYYSVINNEGKTIKTFPSMEVEKSGSTLSLIHGLNAANIPSGIYNLNADISTSTSSLSSKKEISLNRKFEVIQMDYASLKPALSEEEAENSGKIIEYIGTEEQFKFYETLSLNGKAQFLIRFWKELDPSPETLENELLEKIKQRYNYADENFSWGKIKGSSTERGRVLIKYGGPDEIERHDSEAGTLPYEVWIYRQQKSFYFVFGDLRSNGNYTLLHSTKEGEIYNENWKVYISRM
ncbi:MAG: GWxTD domain-containing protein, partial [Ignavibacteriaceae bacterium]